MNEADKAKFLNNVLNRAQPYFNTLDEENDKAAAIIAGCWIDSLLEKLITASFIKDPNVKTLFKDDHLLQSYSSKVHIAYFSGLIPKSFYCDLKIVGEIRNKFAHDATLTLSFKDAVIESKISRCKLAFKTSSESDMPKTKFLLMVSILGTLLIYLTEIVTHNPCPMLMDSMGVLDDLEKHLEEFWT